MPTCIMPNSYTNFDAISVLGNTNDWPENIPMQSRADWEANGLAIARDEFQPCWNNVVGALLNKIGLTLIKGSVMSDPLASFRSGQWNMGEAIEEVFVGLLKAATYDPNTGANEVFQTAKPNVDSMFHRNARRDKFKVTIFEDDLKKAFRTEYGLSTLINQIVSSLNESNIASQYIWAKRVLYKYIMNPDVALQPNQERDVAFPVDRATSEDFLVALRKAVRDVSFNSTAFNPKAAAQRTPPEQLACFVFKDVLNVVDVKALSAAFNVGYAAPEVPITVLDNFGGQLPGKNTIAMLCDRRFFLIYNQMIKNTSIYNPDNLAMNTWLHCWEMYAASYFHNVILLNSTTPVTFDDDGITP